MSHTESFPRTPALTPGKAQSLRERAHACLGVTFVLWAVGFGCYVSRDGAQVLGVAMLLAGSLPLAGYAHLMDTLTQDHFLRRFERLTRFEKLLPRDMPDMPGWFYLAAIASISTSCLLLVGGIISPLAAIAVQAVGFFTVHAFAAWTVNDRLAPRQRAGA